MEKQRVRKFRWFWPWQDQQEEVWLTEMSQSGWHLASMAGPALYTFERGEPLPYVYRLDWQGQSKRDYVQLFRDAGWELVLGYSGWHYFRKLVRPGEQTEIYTDIDSKIAKYQRVLVYMCTSSALSLPALALLIDRPVTTATRIVTFVMLILFLIVIYIVAGLQGRINQLKNQRSSSLSS
jgi:hypothetical protein